METLCAAYPILVSICTLLEKVANIKDTPQWIGLVILVPILIFIVKIVWVLISKVISYFFNAYQAIKIANLEKDSLAQSFIEQDFLDARKDYVVPYCGSIDPSNYDDLRNSVPVKELIYTSLDRELDSDSSKRHILVMADSGMGKTTFLLNYYLRERSKGKKGKRVALVSLSRSDAIDQIKAIDNAKNTVLLLDAFDEDAAAINDYKKRIEELINVAGNFSVVIMTCRTQFFSQESHIPKETGLMKIGAGRAGASRMHEWKLLYLQPFDNVQIEMYIKKAFPLLNWRQRIKARKIKTQISELAVRPMLLTLLPQLVTSKTDAHTLWELYEFMVHQWALREQSFMQPELLKTLSYELAVNMVLNRASRGGERIPHDELVTLLNISSQSLESWKLTGRSLLNRDAKGRYKFAHRSIMEFCFVKAFINGDDDCAKVEWTDMMRELFVSWGNTQQYASLRLKEILSMDLRATSLFPIVSMHDLGSSINRDWVSSIINESRPGRTIPNTWKPFTSKIIEDDEYLRVYDFATGTVFQILKTANLDKDEMQLYESDRNAKQWIDESKNVWALPQLAEFNALVTILVSANKLNILDDRSLYWLSDTDSQKTRCLARAVLEESHVPIVSPSLNILAIAPRKLNGISYVVDVYSANLIRTANSALKGSTIFTFKCEADELWHVDNISSSKKWKLKKS